LQSVGEFLEPDSAQKMKEMSKQCSSVKIYENIFPNESEVAVFRNLNTEEILWESIKFKNYGTRVMVKAKRNQEELVSYLRRNDSAKWNEVFVWIAGNVYSLIYKNKQNSVFLKELMSAIAENVTVTCTGWYERSPLMVAAIFDDKDSILALIKREANVNQQDVDGETALHIAAYYGNINACATLLNKNANIDAADVAGWTPLMDAAHNGEKQMYKFLIDKGADETLPNFYGTTASQLARFQQR